MIKLYGGRQQQKSEERRMWRKHKCNSFPGKNWLSTIFSKDKRERAIQNNKLISKLKAFYNIYRFHLSPVCLFVHLSIYDLSPRPLHYVRPSHHMPISFNFFSLSHFIFLSFSFPPSFFLSFSSFHFLFFSFFLSIPPFSLFFYLPLSS